MPSGFGALLFSVMVVLVVLLQIAQWRFFRAYLDRYGGSEGRQKRWPFWGWGARDMFRPARPPWSWQSWRQPLDDPVVERRRRQHLLAWEAWLAFILVIPIAFALFLALSSQ